jgi:hypothetical protein
MSPTPDRTLDDPDMLAIGERYGAPRIHAELVSESSQKLSQALTGLLIYLIPLDWRDSCAET